ncbi:hypothetical protein H2201_006550 [Coniosporium apollinis]|uniref:Enoyl reductase (ER) domain-containing protein n=1 Tax=Coniosporium apollinis TaxID=61459 RepID=A0ABQ9NLX0_9PEZI|nr:hypothetical protein H2201_006550 [Coniosporium apollinis]
MKAIIIDTFVTDLSTLHPTTAPLPKLWSPTDVLIRITHASITHVDTLYARGQHQNNRRHAIPPFTLGLEFSGIVAQSPAFSAYRPGDRVFGSALGAYAEYIAVPEALLRRVPRGWGLREACALGASGCVAVASLVGERGAGVRAGESVLVLGAAGGLGVVACQVAKAAEARVIGVVGSAEKERVVRGLGVDVVRYDTPGWEEGVRVLTRGEGNEEGGVDVVYDPVGNVESSLRCIKYGGRVLVIGYAGRHGVMEKIPANKILLKSAKVIGYRWGEHGRRFPHEAERVWDKVVEIAEKGEVKAVVYDEEYKGLESVPRAMHDVEANRVWGRAVITIADEGEVLEEMKASNGKAKL